MRFAAPVVRTLVPTLGAVLCVATLDAQQLRREEGATGRTSDGAAGRAIAAERVTRAKRITRTIAIDGSLTPAEWEGAEVAADFTQSTPEPGAAATQRSEARILFDDDALFVAMRLYDSAPDSIAATLARRDFTGFSDWAHVIIDSFRDKRTAFRFALNPAGVKRDGYITGDQEFSEDLGWDAVWDGAARRDSLGWTAEFRIPLSQLRFSKATGIAGTEWGIQFARDIARRSERSHWAVTLPTQPGYVSRFGTLSGIAPEPRRRAEIVPFALSALTHAPGAAGDPLFRQNKVAPKFGADFKLGVTPDFTLTGTILPDFGQVEADPSVVNLSGNEVFFNERRPFFTEGSDLFMQDLAPQNWIVGRDLAFYSRRIGRTPQGEVPDAAVYDDTPDASRLLGAIKLTGRTRAGWAVGAFSAVTEETEARYALGDGTLGRSIVEPMTHYGVLRVQRDFAGGEGSAAFFGTSTHRRLEGTGLDKLRSGALVGGALLRRRFAGARWLFSASALASDVRGTPRAMIATQRSNTHLFQRPDADHVEVDSGATSLQGFNGTVILTKNGGGRWRGGTAVQVKTPGFEANDLGFVPVTDVIHTGAWLGHVRAEPTRLGRHAESWLNLYNRTTLAGDRTIRGAKLFGLVQRNSFNSYSAEAGFDAGALWTQALRGGPALRMPARASLFARFATDPRRAIALDLTHWYMRPLDAPGFQHNVNPAVLMRPSARTELSVGPAFARERRPWQYVATRTSDAGTHYIVGDLRQQSVSMTARVNYAFTPALTLQLYAQPFLAAGRYDGLDEVVAPRAARWDERVRRYTGADYSRNGDGTIRLGSGAREVTIDDPDFSRADFNGNAVLRWEYRPGSTLFVVWAQKRSIEEDLGRFDMGRQAGALFGDGGTNVLTVKWSHWLGR